MSEQVEVTEDDVDSALASIGLVPSVATEKDRERIKDLLRRRVLAVPDPEAEEEPTSPAKPAATPRDWDPPPGQRIYVRNADTGQLGWLVRRNGKDCVRLDRANQEIITAFSGATWLQVVEHRPLNRVQLVQIAFEADKALLRSLGEYEKAKKEWLSLSDKQRVAWIEEGPKDPPIRAMFYRTIMDFLEEHMRS